MEFQLRSLSESVPPQPNNRYKILGYLLLTQENIIGVEYSSGLDNLAHYRKSIFIPYRDQ